MVRRKMQRGKEEAAALRWAQLTLPPWIRDRQARIAGSAPKSSLFSRLWKSDRLKLAVSARKAAPAYGRAQPKPGGGLR